MTWGGMYLTVLAEENNQELTRLVESGELDNHLRDVNQQAQELYEYLAGPDPSPMRRRPGRRRETGKASRVRACAVRPLRNLASLRVRGVASAKRWCRCGPRHSLRPSRPSPVGAPMRGSLTHLARQRHARGSA